MTKQFKPLLASPVEFDKLDYTDLYLSPKLDGIRAIVIGGVVLSRNLKPIPNLSVQAKFKHLEHYDGELICGSPTSSTCYRDTNSACMRVEGEPDVTFYVFDHIEHPGSTWLARYSNLRECGGVEIVGHNLVGSYETLIETETAYLSKGYEGVMLRKGLGPNSTYKFGRATAKSQTLLKVKRFVDNEYEVIGYEERMHNGNVATTNALGHTERSSHKENKSGRGDLGALILLTVDGVEFNCGTGFNDAERAALWTIRDTLPGQWAKVKSFMIGVKDAPRFPTFLGLRDPIDA